MKRRKGNKRERGVALFLAIFALLLLSGIGLAMLFSSDTETSISINYRDKQTAIYAALAGLQEARDRIQPLTGDLGPGTNLSSAGLNIVPTALPSTGSPNVLYIVNPAPGETVAPWDPNNKYFDDELCHEQYFVSNLSVTQGATGVPCPAHPTSGSSLPPGSSWYTWYDNSQGKTKSGASGGGSTTDPTSPAYMEANYHLSSPLKYKWVRITLKADNMTPVTVGTGNGTQVCWSDSNHREQQLTSGYLTNCQPSGDQITNIHVNPNGTGYTSAPTVTIGPPGPGGTQAVGVATIGQIGEGITSVTLTNPGAGYTTVPNVYVVPPDLVGSGAIIKATLPANATVPVSSVGPTPPATTWSSTPACYRAGTAPTVTFTPAGAAATVTMTGNSCIYSYTVSSSSGAGCGTKNATYTVSPSGGSGSATFAGTVTTDNNKKISTGTVWYPSNPGSYSSFPSLTLPTDCSGYRVNPQYGTQINTVTVTAGGAYQPGAPLTVSFVGGTLTGGPPSATATLSANYNPVSLAGLYVQAGANGYGYDVNPEPLVIDPPCTPYPACGGVQATGYASITPANGVLSICISTSCGGNPGNGYSPAFPPAVTIGPPCTPYPACGGLQAAAVAQVGSGAVAAFQGPVYLLTALAVTPSGARAMVQMEAGIQHDRYNFGLGGALTLVGPNPSFGTPNSSPFQMIGTDCTTGTCPSGSPAPANPPGCSPTQATAKDAIGVYDPTNATNPSAVQTIITDLGKPNNYIGANSAPDVANASLGNPTAGDLNEVVAAVAGMPGANCYSTPATANCPLPSPINMGSASNYAIDVVYGNYTMSGTDATHPGYGILVVTGTLTFSGNYYWNGLILVMGSGASVMNGGGNGQINGSVFIANTSGTSLGTPVANWSGGGGNGIQYDHCWADYLAGKIPGVPYVSASPLRVISLRTEVY